MQWMNLHFDWTEILNQTDLENKREVLLGHVVPLVKQLDDNNLIEHWNHSFQDGDIVILLGISNDWDKVDSKIAEWNDSYLEIEHIEGDPDGMLKFWGRKNLETWAQMKALSSTLAIEAMRENLGDSYQEHVMNNRPGHIWLNQLGLDFLEEFQVNQNEATGRLTDFLSIQKEQINSLRAESREIKHALQGFMQGGRWRTIKNPLNSTITRLSLPF